MTTLAAYNEDGRRVGETHHNATIPDATVNRIRELHEAGYGYRRIAKLLAIRWQTVAKIARYQRRAHVPKEWRRPAGQAPGRATAPADPG